VRGGPIGSDATSAAVVSGTSPDVRRHDPLVSRDDRWSAIGGAGATVWLTGLSGAGKSTVAMALERRLLQQGRPIYVLDGDNLRHGLNGDLGFSAADRAENVRRLAHVAALLADAGLVAVVAAISPERAQRDAARAVHRATDVAFLEVHLATPLAACIERDPKGLYRRAIAGELRGMTGIDAPYEAPEQPELTLTPDDGDPDAQAARIARLLPPPITR
jgi:bifunctional enzyme CysN/CysC